MQKLKITDYVLLILVFSAVSIAQGDEYRKNEFCISLPTGWVEMPRDIIDAYEKALAKKAPNFPLQNYDYGFQLESSKNWFEYPYFLVQVKNTGRIPENQLKKFEGVSVQDGVDELKEKVSSVMSKIQTGKMVYDKQNKIIWMRFEANAADIGPIVGLSGMIPTEKGIIQVNGYSLKVNYQKYEPIFRSVAISTAPEPEFEYKANWTDHVPRAIRGVDWGKVAGKTIIYAVIGGIIGLISFLRKKRNK